MEGSDEVIVFSSYYDNDIISQEQGGMSRISF